MYGPSPDPSFRLSPEPTDATTQDPASN